jgi:NAD(P)-dependent dehydrogenase (short-subunit alcohol dehydrogenase family)
MRSPARRLLLMSAIGAGAYAVTRRLISNARQIDFRDRLVLITGGSRGLGLVIARQLADEGAAIVICARDGVELHEALADLRARAQFVAGYVCDLAQPAEMRTMFERIRREVGSIDVLINNAGIIQVGPMQTMTLEDYHQAMAVHFWAPLIATELVLPDMRRRGEGRIVNISSIGGEIGVPHLVPYCASKFALNGMSQAMRAELAAEGIYVTTICPGMMRTGSHFRALFKGQHRDEFTWFSIGNAIPGLSMSAERAASQIIEACRYGRAKRTLSLTARLAECINRIAPEMTADVNALVASMLPAPGGVGRTAVEGMHSTSSWSPSAITTLSDQAAERNNELPAAR